MDNLPDYDSLEYSSSDRQNFSSGTVAKHLLDHDRSMYDLTSLQLDVVQDEEAPLNNSTGNTIRPFKVIGQGGFGSIYVGTIRKATTRTWFQADSRYLLLGYYHGALLAVHPSNEHSLRTLRQGSILDTVPIKVAVKKIEVMAAHELIREASNLKVLWGHRNFVRIYGPTKSQDLGGLCLVMDYVPGCNLNKFLQSRGTALFNPGCLDDEEGMRTCSVWEADEIRWWMEKLKLFREIVIALIVCHSQKVYHGDLKGANILLDKTLVPKMVDFGLGFRRADISYLHSVGGSLFWSAPEVSLPDPDKIHEVVSDPYPCDVYSLGMVLAEMMLDGKIKESFTNVEYFLIDKLEDGCPVSLDQVSSQNAQFTDTVLTKLKDLIDRCCKVERTERIRLQDCLMEVNSIYSDMFSFCSSGRSSRLYENADHLFTDTRAYRDMALKLKERFPEVSESTVLSPSWNMAVDEEENRLVHYFCKLDYAEGVKYILERGERWGFQAETDIPYLSLTSVSEESIETLKYLAASWPDEMEEQVFLPHKVFMNTNPEICRVLLDAAIDFDTWEEEIIGRDPQGGWEFWMKPIHKLAASGKTEMVKMILEDADSGYLYTTTPDRAIETPLYYALVGGDNVETVRFLLERGAINAQPLTTDDYLQPDGRVHLHSITSPLQKRGVVVDSLRLLAEKQGHVEVLEFLNSWSPSSAEPGAFYDATRWLETGRDEGKVTDFLSKSDDPETYVNKTLADFQGGVSKEVMGLHLHIEFPAELAEACCKRGYLGILQFLEEGCRMDLNHLKDGRVQESKGYLLHTAAYYGHVDIVRFLLQRGYLVDSPFFFLGSSPLQRAVEASDMNPNTKKEMVALLLGAGADPNYRDYGGYTAMERVCGFSKGSRDLVQLLLEAGFDCGQKNRWGEDYMDIISQIGRTLG